MAISKEDLKNTYPLPAYNYRVDIEGEPMSFSEVSGLSVASEVTTYKESRIGGSDVGPIVMQMPAQATPPTISLKRGIIRGDRLTYLYQWLKDAKLNLVEKRNVTISLCDEEGKPVIVWKVINAFPKKLDAPSFTSDSNDAAIETMELAADYLFIEEA
ncbi:MAG: phage tail protein [Lewinellaceae bacterium]|nr:phage tail protein [Lewinellaceae bacterium]